MNIEYCPTGDMIADYYTKALIGSQFQKMRNLTLGIEQSMITNYNDQYKQYVREELNKTADAWNTTKSGTIGHDMQKLLSYDESRSVLGKQKITSK